MSSSESYGWFDFVIEFFFFAAISQFDCFEKMSHSLISLWSVDRSISRTIQILETDGRQSDIGSK